MTFTFFDFLKLAGALGFFIYGMKIMSEGIQKIAGNQLRDILNKMTTNRFSGVLTGFLTTTLVQSSSATTVLVVSFVNAGLLKLRQAIGVIMGANIGTTMTAILVTVLGFSKFSLSDYALPIIAIGFPLMFMKNLKAKSWAEFLIGFAILFMGISMLKDAVPDFSADALAFLQDLNDMGLFSTLIFVGIGTLLTVILQSSSAAMTLTLVLCEKGIIGFDMAAAIVLGENIGTTITANLAALIGNIHAKRAARAHLFFNLFGVLWMVIIFPFYLRLIDSYMVSSGYDSPFEVDSAVKWGLTVFHITFNILNTVILVWFVDTIAKIVIKATPSKKGDDKTFKLLHIDQGILSTPELSIIEANKESSRMGGTTAKMNTLVKQLLYANNTKEQERIIKDIKTYEELTDRTDEAIQKYLFKLSESEISEKLSKKVSALISIADDLESIGDIYHQIALIFERKIEEKTFFLPEHRKSLEEMIDVLDKALMVMLSNLDYDNESFSLEKSEELENELNSQRDRLKKMHLKGVKKKEYSVKSASIFSELYTSLERAGDHVIEVSRALKGSMA